jgi:hypothetical protein
MLAGEVNVPLWSASLGMERRHLADIHESRRATGPLIVVPTLGVTEIEAVTCCSRHG